MNNFRLLISLSTFIFSSCFFLESCTKDSLNNDSLKERIRVVEFFDYVSGIPVPGLDLELGYYQTKVSDLLRSEWIAVQKFKTDGIGRIESKPIIEKAFLRPQSGEYLDIIYDVIPLKNGMGPDPFNGALRGSYFQWEKTRDIYRAPLFRKAETDIHIKQENTYSNIDKELRYFGINSTIFGGDDIRKDSLGTFTPFSIWFTNDRPIDTTVTVYLAGELENRLSIYFGDLWMAGEVKKLDSKIFNSSSKNDITITF